MKATELAKTAKTSRTAIYQLYRFCSGAERPGLFFTR